MNKMTFSSKVIKGLGKGTTIGFPTLNFDPACVPVGVSHGIYVVSVRTQAGDFGGVMHFGERPTISGASLSLEVHCFGLNKTLLGKSVTVEIGKRLRDVAKFSDVEELKRAIKNDISQAQEVIKARK